MCKLLALETTTAACSVALWINGEITQRFEIVPQKHAEVILDWIDGLLHTAGVKLKNLDAIAFGSGPGSFMGVRIATGVAQGISYGVDLPVIPVSTLQALAQASYQKVNSERVTAGWDARMDSIYWGVYQIDDKKIMRVIMDDRLDNPKDIKFTQKYGIGVGNAWKVYQDSLSPDFHFIENEIYPDAAAILRIAYYKLKNNELITPEKAEPTYIRENVAHPPRNK